MRAVWTKILADLKRRRLQTAVIAVLVALASGTWTASLTLLAESGRPYAQAAAGQKASHLKATFDSRLVKAEQLPATASLIGATAAGGPWPIAEGVRFERGTDKYSLDVIGRADPTGNVQVLRIVDGRWAQAPGEIVITRSFATYAGLKLGDRVVALSQADKPAFRVVGEVIDVDEADAESMQQSSWVLPDQVSRLGLAAPGLQIAYRFASDPDAAQLDQATTRLRTAFPAGALVSFSSYIETQLILNTTNSILLFFLVVFSCFALLAAGAIIGNVLTSIVLANYREIGMMKAIGFTPLQVIQVFTGQMLVTALAGCVIGLPLGLLACQPLLNRVADALGLGSPPVLVPSIELGVVLLVLAVVALSAALPALRAGRLSAARAITLGAAPSVGKRSIAGRWLSRLPLPRAISLGAADALVRPLRAALTVGVVLIGVGTLTFANGMYGTASAYARIHPSAHIQVQVDRIGSYPDQKAMAIMNAQPDTASILSLYSARVLVAGVSDSVVGLPYRGDPTAIGYEVIEGRWYQAPGEAVASPGLLRAAHWKLGEWATLSIDGKAARMRMVGLLSEGPNVAHQLRFDWSTYLQLFPNGMPDTYYVHLRPGADPADYVRRIQQAEPDFLGATVFSLEGAGPITIMKQVVLALGLMLSLIAVVGVFNTLLLNARERVHELAVLKALGMSPKQLLAVVGSSAVVFGVIGGALGAPLGVGMHHGVFQLISAFVGNPFPPAIYDVFQPLVLGALACIGLALAAVGGLLPARWAARVPAMEILHAE
jgi:putative ABC transport system permease protein